MTQETEKEAAVRRERARCDFVATVGFEKVSPGGWRNGAEYGEKFATRAALEQARDACCAGCMMGADYNRGWHDGPLEGHFWSRVIHASGQPVPTRCESEPIRALLAALPKEPE